MIRFRTKITSEVKSLCYSILEACYWVKVFCIITRWEERVNASINVNITAKSTQRKKNFFRGATSLHDFAKIMLLCLQSWILNSTTFEWKSNKCFSTYTTSYGLAAWIFALAASGVRLLANARKRKWRLTFCKKTCDVVLPRASECCSFLSHYTVIIVA